MSPQPDSVPPLNPQPAKAQPPRPPALSPGAQRTRQERTAALHGRERLERKSVLRGLALLALLVLIVSLLRAGWPRAFPSGWWHRW